MREIKYIFLGSLVILSLEGIYFLAPRIKPKVLSEKAVATEIPSDSPSQTSVPTPTLAPTPKPTPKPTPVMTPKPVPKTSYSSQQINEFINRFASQYSVDPNVIRSIALCESGFKPSAINRDYAGLFQFGSVTWKNIRREIGEDTNVNLRFNAEEAVQTAAYAVSRGKRGIWPNCNP